MNWKHYLVISSVALLITIYLAQYQSAPGYMDAEYYYSMGLRIANGNGLTEPFIWNYLTAVEEIPHPGFTYWMPMPAFLSALGIWISGLDSFVGAKLIHIILAALLPAIAMKIAWEITGKISASVLTGGLAVFPAFYNIFLGTTDSFGIMMILGGFFFLLARRTEDVWKYLGLGAIAGLMHMTRADGLIWLVAGVYYGLIAKEKRTANILEVIAGYLVVMAPWFVRNLLVFGVVMPPGTSRTFWLQEYNDLFSYYPETLTFQNWFGQGIRAIIKNIQVAGLANIKNAFLVQGQVILTPFIAIGAWKYRRDRSVRGIYLVWVCIFSLMSVIFPFAGLRGGFTHSGAAFQTLFWAFAGSGFFTIISWGVEKRDWIEEKAGIVFGGALVLLVAISSLFIYRDRVIGDDIEHPLWENSFQEAVGIADSLRDMGTEPDDLIMINNPPGFYAATGFSSIVIPNGDLGTVLAAGKDYGAKYLVLERNHPLGLAELYRSPGDETRLEYIGSWNQAVIFRLP